MSRVTQAPAAKNTALTSALKIQARIAELQAQLAALAERHGIVIGKKILRYDGRPFTYENLLARVQEVLP